MAFCQCVEGGFLPGGFPYQILIWLIDLAIQRLDDTSRVKDCNKCICNDSCTPCWFGTLNTMDLPGFHTWFIPTRRPFLSTSSTKIVISSSLDSSDKTKGLKLCPRVIFILSFLCLANETVQRFPGLFDSPQSIKLVSFINPHQQSRPEDPKVATLLETLARPMHRWQWERDPAEILVSPHQTFKD